MRKIVVGLFISLDGVTQGPGPSDDYEYAGWSMPYFTPEVGAFIGGQMANSDGLLLGRNTYESFKATFANMTGPDADGMNNARKYVVSSTLTSADWANSSVINGDVIAEIKKLKQQDGRDIAISGSIKLVQSLMKHGLIDEFALIIEPIVLGTGQRLFEGGVPKTGLKLTESNILANGVMTVRYQVEPNA